MKASTRSKRDQRTKKLSRGKTEGLLHLNSQSSRDNILLLESVEMTEVLSGEIKAEQKPEGLTRLQTLRQSKNDRQKLYNEKNEVDPETLASDILTLRVRK